MSALRHAVDHLRRITPPPRIDIANDRALLVRFAATRDESAFTEMVRRHGPLVRGVCGRVLGPDPAADDAFQATFLLLARKAGQVGWHDSVAGWLHRAAWHFAQKVRREALRRQRLASGVATSPRVLDESNHGALMRPRSPDPGATAAWRELCQLLDEELARLPERLRAPLALCYLEGRTRDEAAAQLSWSLGTLKRRLARARMLLKARLTRRGVTLAVAGLPAAPAGDSVSAAVVAETARRAASYALGESVVGPVAALLQGGWASVKPLLIASAVVFVGLAAGAAGWRASRERERPEDVKASTASAAGSTSDPSNMPREPLPPGAVARLGTLTFCHGDAVAQLLTTADGRSIITIGGKAVRVWDAESGREAGSIVAPEGQSFVTGALMPGGDRLVLTRFDGVIQVWDWKTRRETQTITPKVSEDRGPAPPGCYAFDPAGRLAVVGYQTQTGPVAILVDLATGKPKVKLSDQIGPPYPAIFTADGKTVIAGDPNGKTIRLFDVATGREQRAIAAPMEVLYYLAVSPDGRWLAVAGAGRRVMPFQGGGTMAISVPDKSVHLLDLATGREAHHFDSGAVGKPSSTLLFTPDNHFLLTGSAGASIRQWDLTTGKQVRELAGTWTSAPALAMSPDGKSLLAADTVVRCYDWHSGTENHQTTKNPGAVSALAFLPDGRSLMTGSDGVAVWDTSAGKELRQFAVPKGQTDGMVLAPDGRSVAVVAHAGEPHSLVLLDTATGRKLGEVKAGDGFLIGPVISPDGKLLATATFDEKTNRSTVRIWDYDTLTERRVVKLRHGAGFLAFSPDGLTLRGVGSTATSGGAEVFFSIDIGTGETTNGRDLGATNQYHAWATSVDHQLFAAACQTNQLGAWVAQKAPQIIHIFDAARQKFERKLDDAKTMTLQIAFAPDNRRLATGAVDGTVTLWDATTGKRLREFAGHRGSVSSLAFSPDGKRLASGSIDTTVLIWSLNEDKPEHK
jgi:RNA polymerase sigma factor (sigma-70 family)